MNRRHFLAAAGPALRGLSLGAASRTASRGVNLVPTAPGSAPNYWCTWGIQMSIAAREQPDAPKLDPEAWTRVIENYITEDLLFGPDGWARNFLPKVRRDLYLMLDGGWSTTYSSFVPHPDRFPSFAGEPRESIRRINDAVKQAGWRGAGLWCRDTPGGAADAETMRNLKYGGVGYLKIDVGDMSFHLAALRDEMHARLTLEHVSGVDGGLNGRADQDGRYPALAPDSVQAKVLKHTDVYRIYDLQGPVDVPTALDRVTQSIKVVEGQTSARALINAEHETYLAAVLGCTVGIMQHPPLQPGRSSGLDHVVRAVRWQRIAAPMPSGSGFLRLDEEVLTDAWAYNASNTSDAALIGKEIKQGAPARVARNMELPMVSASGEKPFVLAGRFPNGAIAIGALPRTQPGRAGLVPAAEVSVHVAGATGPFGIFGSFAALRISGHRSSKALRVLAQDLAGDESEDITPHITMTASELHIPGDVLDRIGRSAGAPGDPSPPALLLQLV